MAATDDVEKFRGKGASAQEASSDSDQGIGHGVRRGFLCCDRFSVPALSRYMSIERK